MISLVIIVDLGSVFLGVCYESRNQWTESSIFYGGLSPSPCHIFFLPPSFLPIFHWNGYVVMLLNLLHNVSLTGVGVGGGRGDRSSTFICLLISSTVSLD